MPARFVLAIVAILTLSSCSTVTVDSPAGDAPVRLESETVEGEWIAPGGTRVEIQIKENNERCILAVESTDAEGEKERTIWEVRELAGRMVITGLGEDGKQMSFFRMSLGGDFIALFAPLHDPFEAAVAKGTLAGTFTKPDQSKGEIGPGMVHLVRFRSAEAAKLGGVLACFDADPSAVLVRTKKAPAAPKKKRR